MEFAQLQAFERAARDGNFSRAAEALDLTQPAVSTRIAGLERELGGVLFERRGRQLVLTALGERFLPYAERMLAMRADSLETVQNFHSGKLGQVKLAAAAPFVISFLPDVLEIFREEFPAVDIRIHQRLKPVIFDMLYDGTVNLGLIYAPLFDNNVIDLAHFQEPIRGVAAPNHPIIQQQLHQGGLRMSDLYEHTIFRATMFERMTAFIDAVVEQARKGSGGAIVAVPSIMVVRLVIQGQGVSFLPISHVERHVADGRMVYLDIEDMPQILSEPLLVALAGRKMDTIHQEFIRILKRRWRHMLVHENPL